jgi:hypothetical protein
LQHFTALGEPILDQIFAVACSQAGMKELATVSSTSGATRSLSFHGRSPSSHACTVAHGRHEHDTGKRPMCRVMG